MKHRKALLQLLQALRIIGIREDDLDITPDEEGTGLKLVSNHPNGNRLTIIISEFWRYPTLSCYFVNFEHPSGDFSCNVGTPHIEQALVNIGDAMAKFVWPKGE